MVCAEVKFHPMAEAQTTIYMQEMKLPAASHDSAAAIQACTSLASSFYEQITLVFLKILRLSITYLGRRIGFSTLVFSLHRLMDRPVEEQ
eukprot:3900762-Amphidinium_carterae.1